jgi:hypothetical protein
MAPTGSSPAVSCPATIVLDSLVASLDNVLLSQQLFHRRIGWNEERLARQQIRLKANAIAECRNVAHRDRLGQMDFRDPYAHLLAQNLLLVVRLSKYNIGKKERVRSEIGVMAAVQRPAH